MPLRGAGSDDSLKYTLNYRNHHFIVGLLQSLGKALNYSVRVNNTDVIMYMYYIIHIHMYIDSI